MKVELPELKFAADALEPFISEKTIQFHHGKHHKAYVDNTFKLTAGTSLDGKSLEEIISVSFDKKEMAGIFNNAAQVWNHSFYWDCINPECGGKPEDKIAGLINSSFGSYEVFAEKFINAAMTQFGSGWAWLILNNDNTLEITKTSNADTPIAHKQKPVLTIDVWEHAYYLDYQNRRADYVKAFLDKLVNWDFVNSQIG